MDLQAHSSSLNSPESTGLAPKLSRSWYLLSSERPAVLYKQQRPRLGLLTWSSPLRLGGSLAEFAPILTLFPHLQDGDERPGVAPVPSRPGRPEACVWHPFRLVSAGSEFPCLRSIPGSRYRDKTRQSMGSPYHRTQHRPALSRND